MTDNKLRVRVTALDGFDYYQSSELGFDAYLTRILGEEGDTDATRFGTQLHEHLQQRDTDFLRRLWVGSTGTVELLPPQAVEFQCRTEYAFSDVGTVLFVGHVDAIHGRTLIDYKTTASGIDLEKYIDSWQWRSYLSLYPRAETFRYEVFRCNKARDKLFDHEWMELHPYRSMAEEVEQQVWQFAKYLRGLESDGHIVIDPATGKLYRPLTVEMSDTLIDRLRREIPAPVFNQVMDLARDLKMQDAKQLLRENVAGFGADLERYVLAFKHAWRYSK